MSKTNDIPTDEEIVQAATRRLVREAHDRLEAAQRELDEWRRGESAMYARVEAARVDWINKRRVLELLIPHPTVEQKQTMGQELRGACLAILAERPDDLWMVKEIAAKLHDRFRVGTRTDYEFEARVRVALNQLAEQGDATRGKIKLDRKVPMNTYGITSQGENGHAERPDA